MTDRRAFCGNCREWITGFWENNKSLPNIDFCVKLADLYGIPLNELIGLDLKK